jgi:hypothetical protein
MCTMWFNKLWILPTESSYVFRMILSVNSNYFLNCINQLSFLMAMGWFLFQVRKEFLNIIWTSSVKIGPEVLGF